MRTSMVPWYKTRSKNPPDRVIDSHGESGKMAGRVLPSQVVAAIHGMFPKTATQQDSPADRWVLGSGNSTSVAAIAEMVDHIPAELISLDGPDYIAFIASMAVLRDAAESWRIHGRGYSISAIEGMGDLNPLTHLRRALEKCPDVYPAPATVGLTFIADADLQENLRSDISSATGDLANGEWKSATVVAGSVVEALLLWALQQRTTAEVDKAVKSLVSANVLNVLPPRNLEKWDLHEYVEVAAELNIVKPDTATQVRITRNFRNLIHPGRAARLGQSCNRGTALSALAAVEHVVQDLTPRPRAKSGTG